LTIHYYQLLFSGQLGFHLAAQFENHPNLLGLTLDDSNADESYSVFDHPTARIFVRDDPYPYSSAQLFQKLLNGVRLPSPGANLSGIQRALLLAPQQSADHQRSPPFSAQFPSTSITNSVPMLYWWLVFAALVTDVFPFAFLQFRALSHRGYIYGKTLGILLLACLTSLHVLVFRSVRRIFVVQCEALSGVGTRFIASRGVEWWGAPTRGSMTFSVDECRPPHPAWDAINRVPTPAQKC